MPRSVPVNAGAVRPSSGLATAVASWGVRVASTTPITTRTTRTPPATQRVGWRRRPVMPGRDAAGDERPHPVGRRVALPGPSARGAAPVHQPRGRPDAGSVAPPPAPRHQGEQAPEPDEQAAGPQPGHERLDDHADGHRAPRQVVDGLVPRRGTQPAHGVEGQVDVAEEARVDGRRPDDRQRTAEAGGRRGEHGAVHLDHAPRCDVRDGEVTVRSPSNSKRWPS